MTILNLNQPKFQNGNITPFAEWYNELTLSAQRQVDKIQEIIRTQKTVEARKSEMFINDIQYDTFPMGSGGVGQIKEMKDHYRIQVGYGVGKHNYAVAAILKK